MAENIDNRETLLLVDDNPTNLQVLRQALQGMDCKMLFAKNGERALSIAAEGHPSLILLDIMMPGIDGFEVCRRLKSDPATEDIPVIFLSALVDTQDKVKGLQLGAVDYVSKPFQPEEVKARVDTHLTIHRLRREVQDQKDQLEHELEVVSEVQRRLLPKQLPEIKGLHLAAHYATSRFAGGDYYDILKLPDNQWGFMVADAEGHSAPAAVLMAMTCSLLHSYSGPPTDPAEVLTYINQTMCKVADPSFVTALYAVFDADQRTLRFARAGHPPPMLYRREENKSVELAGKGVFPLGIYPYDQIPVHETRLGSGDRLLLYTDGVTERFDMEGNAYGENRLLGGLAADAVNNPRLILDGIIEDLQQFAGGRPPDDDQALVLGVIE
ncbi:MAG: SpoIIE family protein phosphatase [Desulfobacterales bacterium]|jgi:sigma-B regulation protein RsbU (phosphoserine phosphatase)